MHIYGFFVFVDVVIEYAPWWLMALTRLHGGHIGGKNNGEFDSMIMQNLSDAVVFLTTNMAVSSRTSNPTMEAH